MMVWFFFSLWTVRSNLIPNPPTYNSKYGYLSWESYYNLSYYTRLLPPVPDDCPTPLGVKGQLIKVQSCSNQYLCNTLGCFVCCLWDVYMCYSIISVISNAGDVIRSVFYQWNQTSHHSDLHADYWPWAVQKCSVMCVTVSLRFSRM